MHGWGMFGSGCYTDRTLLILLQCGIEHGMGEGVFSVLSEDLGGWLQVQCFGPFLVVVVAGCSIGRDLLACVYVAGIMGIIPGQLKYHVD